VGLALSTNNLAASSADLADEGSRLAETIDLAVDGMHCGACMTTIEGALMACPGVVRARANLTARRVTAEFDPLVSSTQALVQAIGRVGYTAAEILDARTGVDAARADDLLRRLGVAGFAAANIMLLSVSVWAGASSDMEASAQSLFHWLSALIALPATAFAAEPFFRSAASALRVRRLNMDVPISLGITLATAMSLYQTSRGSEQVYFDAAIMLTFFLLVGRYLDEAVRVHARGAAENLLGLKALSAHVLNDDGTVRTVAARNLVPGMRVLVAAGEYIPVDGFISEGQSEVEESLITGETLPKLKTRGSQVYAGTISTTGPLTVEATAADDRTLVAEIGRLMQVAEQGRGRYVRLADRAASKYAPAVHLLGLTTFTGWMIAGAGWEQALTYAIAVLIITCPCALALAVPVVQVAAATRLFHKGLILKAADGLERLAEVDTVVLDKTGTLTLGEPRLVDGGRIDRAVLQRAAALAATSRHPYSRAIVRAATEQGILVEPASSVSEAPGAGLIVDSGHGIERLGSAAFTEVPIASSLDGAEIWYARDGHPPQAFRFVDALRTDAAQVVIELRAAGYRVELLSGDRTAVVASAAGAAGIDDFRGDIRPDGKLTRLAELKAQGRRVLMIGDGLNDAPALAAGHASLSPSTAADISQTAADGIFQGERLAPVLEALAVAAATRRMSLQNFAIALAYNVVSVPLAMAGHVTPLFAALAMSLSSIAVVANALRLQTKRLVLAHHRPDSIAAAKIGAPR
jgi:Cu2+-exporting ATPase